MIRRLGIVLFYLVTFPLFITAVGLAPFVALVWMAEEYIRTGELKYDDMERICYWPLEMYAGQSWDHIH